MKLSASRRVQKFGHVEMKDAVVIAGGNSERGLLLSAKLATEQYCAYFCQSFTDFCATINQDRIAVILLLYPDESDVIYQLFKKNTIPDLVAEIPIVFISRSSIENNMVHSLHYLAKEFLIEPISVGEICKLINDLIDSRLQSDREHVLAIGDLVLNKEMLTVTWRNKKLPLHPRQVYLLDFLMRNPRRPITRIELLNNVWSKDICVEDRTVDRNIKRIRDTFRRQAKGDPIQTVHGVGYVFNDQFEQLSSTPRERARVVKPIT
jgi:DNA-binding response OmpR family regulator